MLVSALERLAIKIFETGQKKSFFSSQEKEIPPSGFYLGRSPKPYNPREEENVFLSPEEMGGHWYVVGGTGAGKTSFIENSIRDDVIQNRGMCIFDGHGDVSERLITFIASLWQKKTAKEKEEMARRLILVEPFHDRITGFNPLEVPARNSVYASALEMMGVFKRRWPDFGPRMEELFRNSLVTLAANGLTLLELPLLLTDRHVRHSAVEGLADQEIK